MSSTTLAQLDFDLTNLATKAVMAVVIIILVGLAYWVMSQGLSTLERKRKLPGDLLEPIRKVLRWIAIVGAALIIFDSWGWLGGLWTAITAVAAMVAIGFVAVWSVLSNAFCSVILLMSRTFRVGDHISFPADEVGGKVVNFSLLFTTLQADDGELIQVPNNMFFQKIIRRRPGEQRIALGEQLTQEENAQV